MRQKNLQGEVLAPEVVLEAKHLTPEEQLVVKQRNVAVKHPSEQWGHWVLKSKVVFDLLSQGKSFLMEARLTGLAGDEAGHFATGQYDLFCPDERTVYEICDGDLTPAKIGDRKKYGFPVVYIEWLSGYALRVAARYRGVPIWLAYHRWVGPGRSRAPLELMKDPHAELQQLWVDLLRRQLVPAMDRGDDTLLRKHEVRAFELTDEAAAAGGFSRKPGGHGRKKAAGRKTLKFYSGDLLKSGRLFGADFWDLSAAEAPQVLRAFGSLRKLDIYGGGNKGLCCVLTERGLADLQKAAEAKDFNDLSSADFAGNEEE